MIEIAQAAAAMVAAVLLVLVADRERHAVMSRLRVALAICLALLAYGQIAEWLGHDRLSQATRDGVTLVILLLIIAVSASRLVQSERQAPPRTWR